MLTSLIIGTMAATGILLLLLLLYISNSTSTPINNKLQEENSRLLAKCSRLENEIDEIRRNINTETNRAFDKFESKVYLIAEEKVRDKITKLTDQRDMYKHRLEQLTGVHNV